MRRETAGAYLKAAGIAVRPAGSWGRRRPATPVNETSTESSAAKPANEMTTDPGGQIPPEQQVRSSSPPSTSACESYREIIELGLSRGRNAMAIWQDMVSQHGYSGGYQTVKRFVGTGSDLPKLRILEMLG